MDRKGQAPIDSVSMIAVTTVHGMGPSMSLPGEAVELSLEDAERLLASGNVRPKAAAVAPEPVLGAED
jgi:hypothetical protein